MISEDVLGDLLRLAGDEAEVPADGLEDVRSAIAQQRDQMPPQLGPVRKWSARQWHWPSAPRLAGIAAGVVIIAGIATGIALSGGHNTSSSSSSAGAAASAPAASRAAGAGAASQGSAGSTASGGKAAPGDGRSAGVPATASAPRVVKTASISLQVTTGEVATTLDRLRALPASLGGFVAASNATLNSDDPNGTATLRVPVAAYSTLRDAITKGTYGKPLTVQESGQDVTSQYTDLAARINALQTTREAYLTMLSRADTIGDTLAVQQQLNTVQQQLEQLQGQQKLLADQSDFATVTVTVTQQGSAALAPGKSRSGFDKAAHDAWSGFSGGLQGLLAASGVIVLVLLIVGVIGVGGRFGIRIVRRRLI